MSHGKEVIAGFYKNLTVFGPLLFTMHVVDLVVVWIHRRTDSCNTLSILVVSQFTNFNEIFLGLRFGRTIGSRLSMFVNLLGVQV